MKIVDLTLRIKYDETKYRIPPRQWNWAELLDFWGENEEVIVVSSKEKARNDD